MKMTIPIASIRPRVNIPRECPAIKPHFADICKTHCKGLTNQVPLTANSTHLNASGRICTQFYGVAEREFAESPILARWLTEFKRFPHARSF